MQEIKDKSIFFWIKRKGKSARIKLYYLSLRFYILILKLLGYKIVHFIHIGKTGGSSIKTAIARKRGLFHSAIITNKYLFVTEHHSFKLSDVKENEFAFFTVRDPIERFISGFYSRLRQGQPRNFNPWLDIEKEVFSVFTTPNQLAEALYCENNDYRKLAEKAMKGILHVKSSYWDWFLNEEYMLNNRKKIIFILRQKKLTEDYSKFCQELGIYIGELPYDENFSHKTPDHFDKAITDLGNNNLQKWYKREYDFLHFIEINNFITSD